MASHSYLPPAEAASPSLTPTITGWYSIYPRIKYERLSRPEPPQENDLPGVATEVLAIPAVSWLSRPSVPLGTVDVNNLPQLLCSVQLQWDSDPCL